jgi:hypothetical protein
MGAKMTRFETVFALYETARDLPYQPGSNDCFFLGLQIVDALTGTARVKEFKGSYRTLAGAHKALLKRGYESVIPLMETLCEPIGWGSAHVGDLAVIVEVNGAEHLAFHGGNGWHSITADGPRSWPLSAAKQAFKV